MCRPYIILFIRAFIQTFQISKFRKLAFLTGQIDGFYKQPNRSEYILHQLLNMLKYRVLLINNFGELTLQPGDRL